MSRSLLAAAALTGAAAQSSNVWPPAAYASASAMLAKMSLADKLQLAAGTGKTYPYVGIVPGNAKLGIPSMGLEDGPQGVADGALLVTAWPSALTVVASWDNALMFEFGRAMAEEQFSKGSSVMLVRVRRVDVLTTRVAPCRL
jgi:beta-glucosidase